MGFVANAFHASTLRVLIWPEAKAQNNIAAVSADGNTVCVLIRRLNSSCSRSMAFVANSRSYWVQISAGLCLTAGGRFANCATASARKHAYPCFRLRSRATAAAGLRQAAAHVDPMPSRIVVNFYTVNVALATLFIGRWSG